MGSAYPSSPFFTPTISLAEIIFCAVSFDYRRPTCEIASRIKTRAWLLTNLLIRGKVVSLTGDVVVQDGKPAECLPLLGAKKESDMATQKQPEPSIGLDRRQLLASAAALSIGTIPGIEAAAEIANPGQAKQPTR